MAKKQKASLTNIAQATNLTVASVSRILRNKDRFAPETRQRVLETARRLQYRPNLLVTGMQTGRTRTMGVMVTVHEGFFSRVGVGIHEALCEADYVPIFLWPHEPEVPGGQTNQLEQIHRLVDRRVDAVILRPHEAANDNYYRTEIYQRGIPLVTVDRQLAHTVSDFVGSEDYSAGVMAAQHLLSLGHTVLGHVAGPRHINTAADRLRGFEDTVREAQVDYRILEDPTFGNGQKQARALLSSKPRPTALFLASDHMLSGVYDAAADLGQVIPEDLSIVGCAGLRDSKIIRPAATTIRQDPEEIGRAAVRIALDRLDGNMRSVEPVHVRIPVTLIERHSTAPPHKE